MQLVLQYHCYGCHQANALDAGGLVLSGHDTSINDAATYPPNLTSDPATGLGCWTNQQIATALLDGFDNQDAALCVMPQFRGKFIEAGVDVDAAATNIVEFLRSLHPVVNQVPDTVCPSPPSPSDAGDAGSSASDAASDAGDATLD
jgi:hypothetical protein